MDYAELLRKVGYCVVPRILDHVEIDALRVAFSEDGSGHTEHVDVTKATPHAELWLSLPQVHTFNAIVVQLLGDRFETRVHGRNPRPGGGQQGLHADRPPATMGGIEAITSLWMLDDFTVESGATRVVPGSHLGRRAVPKQFAQPLDHHPDERIVTGTVGDVLILDSHLWHSGRRNNSASPRRSVQMICTRTMQPT